MAAPLVQIRGLTKAYHGQPVLAGVSLDIAEGEVFGYIGPNGAGKTTTLKILAGLITQYQGEVRIDGADIAADRARGHRLIGFLPQGVGFQAWRTVESALDAHGARENAHTRDSPWAAARMGVVGRACRSTTDACADEGKVRAGQGPAGVITVASTTPSCSRSPTASSRWRLAIAPRGPGWPGRGRGGQ